MDYGGGGGGGGWGWGAKGMLAPLSNYLGGAPLPHWPPSSYAYGYTVYVLMFAEHWPPSSYAYGYTVYVLMFAEYICQYRRLRVPPTPPHHIPVTTTHIIYLMWMGIPSNCFTIFSRNASIKSIVFTRLFVFALYLLR